MTDDRRMDGSNGRRRWHLAEFFGLIFFLLVAAAVLPMVRDSYILQDVWVAICGVIGLN